MNRFKFIYLIPPIDFWANAIVANEDETKRVLSQMPETPKDYIVFKTYVPGDTELITVYMCKADNNGDTYLFTDEDFVTFYTNNIIRRI